MVREKKAFSYLNLAGFQPYSNREWVWFEHRLKHDLKGPSYAMQKKKEKDQIDPIPCIEHSFLSIDRKEDLRQILDFAFFFFFLGILHIQGSLPQAPPPPYD